MRTALPNPAPTLSLHLTRRELTFLRAPLTLVLFVVISVIVNLIFRAKTGLAPLDPDYEEFSRNNPGLFFSLAGYVIYMGVQAVAATFPLALAFGTSRRNFAAGTLVFVLGFSAYMTLLSLLGLGVELLTGHWFGEIHAFDVTILGNGDPWILCARVFSMSILFTGLGAIFGAQWLRGETPALGVTITLVTLGLLVFVNAALLPLAALTLGTLIVFGLLPLLLRNATAR